MNNQETPADIQKVINLYRKFSKYGKNTDEELYYHVLESIKLKQYKTFEENNEVIAFANWAFLNKEAEDELIKTKTFSESDWNSGDNVWVIDVLSIKNGEKIGRWLKNKFKKFKWMRSDKDFNFYRISSRGY